MSQDPAAGRGEGAHLDWWRTSRHKKKSVGDLIQHRSSTSAAALSPHRSGPGSTLELQGLHVRRFKKAYIISCWPGLSPEFYLICATLKRAFVLRVGSSLQSLIQFTVLLQSTQPDYRNADLILMQEKRTKEAQDAIQVDHLSCDTAQPEFCTLGTSFSPVMGFHLPQNYPPPPICSQDA